MRWKEGRRCDERRGWGGRRRDRVSSTFATGHGPAARAHALQTFQDAAEADEEEEEVWERRRENVDEHGDVVEHVGHEPPEARVAVQGRGLGPREHDAAQHAGAIAQRPRQRRSERRRCLVADADLRAYTDWSGCLRARMQPGGRGLGRAYAACARVVWPSLPCSWDHGLAYPFEHSLRGQLSAYGAAEALQGVPDLVRRVVVAHARGPALRQERVLRPPRRRSRVASDGDDENAGPQGQDLAGDRERSKRRRGRRRRRREGRGRRRRSGEGGKAEGRRDGA